ncbi:MAG TPA: restriction endonuclease subunit S, partial [Anaerolineales bacterium]|nr:restriction endonuclease subunit S [Anaerolineales bacterium]
MSLWRGWGMQVNLPKYPDGWVTESLDAAAHINPESLGEATPPMFRFRYIDISSVSHGEIDWATVTDQTFSTSPSRARRIVRPRDVLLCTVRPGLQSHTFANWSDADGYVCSTGFAVIHATDRVEPRYLFHLIFSEAVSAQLRQLETGSNYPAVNESDVRSLRVPIAPLPEQRRIAEILDTIDAAIQQTDTLIAKLKQRKAGLLHDLLTRGLDQNGELRDPLAHPEQFKDSPLGRIPREWGLVAVGEVFDMQLGKMLSKAARTGRNP